MIPETFRQVLASGKPGVVLCAGSDSDLPHVARITAVLDSFGISHITHICSAHKQPIELMSLIDAYNALDANIAFIGIAGMTDALSGVLSFHALAPVVSCPPIGPNESVLNNPPGSSNAVIYHPKNVGRFMAQLFACVDPEIRTKLLAQKEKKLVSLAAAERKLREA